MTPASEEQADSPLEIAHVLFMDIVGYSKLLNDEQREALHELNRIVRDTDAARAAESAGKLICLPTGDGMALVFTTSTEAPVECALQISQALQAQPSLPLRMGIHSGPVQHVVDVNGRENVAGGGINVAQRVMDCGDAGHILVSRRVADDLAGSRRWQPYLHDLGEVEVKHGLVVSMANVYADAVGNPAPPAKFGGTGTRRRRLVPSTGAARPSSGGQWLLAAGGLVVAVALAFALWRWNNARPAGTAAAASAPVAPTPAAVEKSVAVLPFDNLSDDKANSYFTDGVQDEILTDLAKVADLKVISRTSVMQYKDAAKRSNLREVGAQLGVAHVLEGSVQRSGNKVRVTAQLIDTRTDTHQWAEHYDRDLADVFAIQSEIAEAIAGQLKAKLSPQEKSAIDAPPTSDLEAYDLYLRALALYLLSTEQMAVGEKLPNAVRLLEEALTRDPKFLNAWCLLERVHSVIYWQGYDHTAARLESMKAALQHAQDLQPDAGETHLAHADYYYYGFRDYDHALEELNLARRALPNNAEVYAYSGYIVRRQGKWDECVRDLERSLELDPRNILTLDQLALTYQQMQRYDDEARAWGRALAIAPDDLNNRQVCATVPLDERADIGPFRAIVATLLKENPGCGPEIDDPVVSFCDRTPEAVARVLANFPSHGSPLNGVTYPHAYWEGVVARSAGDATRARAAFTAARAEAEKTQATLSDPKLALSLLGLIDAGLGRKEQAIDEGRRACEFLPVSTDSIDGQAFAVNLAQIYAWTGEKAAAVDQIAEVEKRPNLLTYGQLKLHPVWDDLRGDPRFEALVASLAPKSSR